MSNSDLIFSETLSYWSRVYIKQNLANRKRLKLNFERVVFLLKQIVISNELNNFCHDLIPKLKNFLLFDKSEKPPDQVLRNYDYELNDIYSNLSDWNTSVQSEKIQNSSSTHDIKASISDTATKNSFKLSEFKREFKNQSKSVHNLSGIRTESEIEMSETGSYLTHKKSVYLSTSFSDNGFRKEKKSSKKSSKSRPKSNSKHQCGEILSNIPRNAQISFLNKKKLSQLDSSTSRKDSKSSQSVYENQFKRQIDTSSTSDIFYEDTLVSSSPQEINNFSGLPQSKQEKILRSILNEISTLNHKVDSRSREDLKSKYCGASKLTDSSLNTLDDADSEQDIAEFYSHSDFKETDFEENMCPDQKRIKYFSNYKRYFDSENNDSMNRQAFYLDQDWSLSQNSNTFNLSLNEQRIINEVVKKLKPFLVKCVRKEVRKHFENSRNLNRYESSMTKIGDF
ncbi:hypothetical protein BpHYR1_052858 [Brachionus plicatilis]|uniref:Uncharacterized protein n=1 Tax=Brachionus plicatilis TaxID=10195 RepID=A0A3M7RJ56_BRAPC|nr:hypothetical protein BpHYR1_052858 [Brachionus plicatilis]